MANINMKTIGLTTLFSFASLMSGFTQKFNQPQSQICFNNNTDKYDTFVKMNEETKQEVNLALLQKEKYNNYTNEQKNCKKIDKKQNANVKQAKGPSAGAVAIFLSIILGVYGFMYSYEQGRRE